MGSISNKTFFAVEYKDGARRYIIEQKILEILFIDDWEIQELEDCGLLQNIGSHENKRKDLFRCFELNDKGECLYHKLKRRENLDGQKYIQALYEMSENVNVNNLPWMKIDIDSYKERCGIGQIYKFNDAKSCGNLALDDDYYLC